MEDYHKTSESLLKELLIIFELIKKTIPECPILLDIPGKKIRTAKLTYEPIFKRNDVLILTTTPGFNGERKISLTSDKLHLFLKN